ncbi:Late Golgi protein sorting complex, subunit Vps53 [Ceraceosorus bombacis]|uniref:Late Golgi protein sorting complex, subunit Vps53 n=1 Tax=Ceraceosorus bombacis TaxID=401625 RepID=A0A0P1BRD7_9BASI|nr:Late Golgi protein sorting complex, subunit Vps53 [Ceraceosorus bombacis]
MSSAAAFSSMLPTAAAQTSAALLPSALPLHLQRSINTILSHDDDDDDDDDISTSSTFASARIAAAAGTTSTSASASTAHSLTAFLSEQFNDAQDLQQDSISLVQARLRQAACSSDDVIDQLLLLYSIQIGRSRPNGSSVREHDAAAAAGAGEGVGAAAAAAAAAAAKEAQVGQDEVTQLLRQLSNIRDQAAEAEGVVRDITRDIRSLDTAKRNIVTSMTSLKRLQMLVNAVSQLSRLAQSKRYAECASALTAVESLKDSFVGFAGVARLNRVAREVEMLKAQLEKDARQEFERFFGQPNPPPISSTILPSAAQAIAALGPQASQSLHDFYTTLTLKEYKRIFRSTDEAGGLDNVSRRYAWFRRVLRTYDEDHAAAFHVAGWDVGRELLRRFSEQTREDLRSLLIRMGKGANVDVLLDAMNATLEFQTAMARKYGGSYEEITAAPNLPPTTAAGNASVPTLTAATSTGHSLSSTFDPHLVIFVEAQDKRLQEMFVGYRQSLMSRPSIDGGSAGGGSAGMQEASSTIGMQSSSGSVGRGGGSAVLASSTELFYFYRQTLEAFARLSTGAAFRDLCFVFCKYLKMYAEEVLRFGLMHRTDPASASGLPAPRRSNDTRYGASGSRENEMFLGRICKIVNTADYCATTADQLAEKLREKVDEGYEKEIDLQNEKEGFVAVIAQGIQALLREADQALEVPFQQMFRPNNPWSTLVEASGKSPYVDELASSLEHVAVVVRLELENKRFVRSWCDKAVGTILARFTNTLVRLKPLSSLVSKQLLLDLKEIRSILLELPRYSLSEEGSASAAASYQRHITKSTQRLESLLDLLCLEDPGAEELIEKYTQLIGDRSFGNFQKILDLRGVRRTEQNGIMDTFVTLTSQNDQLSETSFLTSLDMDPPTNATTPGPFLSFAAAGSTVDGSSTPPLGRGSAFDRDYNPTATGAARAFGDLKRFGSMLVGRREEGRR